MDMFNKVHIFEPMKSRIYEPINSLISLISLVFNYANPNIDLIFNYNEMVPFIPLRRLCY